MSNGEKMTFRDYLETLFGSRVKIKILRTLWRYRGKEFTVRELAKFLGVSHTGIGKALNDLEKTNAITVRTVGKSYVFKVNTKSYVASIIGKAFEAEDRTFSELLETIRKGLESPAVISAVLFGSVAEGRETSKSDIDVFIVTDHKEKTEGMVSKLQMVVSEKFGNAISAYYISKEEFRKRQREPLVKQVLQKHVLICGKPLSEVHVGKS
ncbi:MAG: nucleotidyltransferase domain-containing protein [Thermoproteota archaeon]